MNQNILNTKIKVILASIICMPLLCATQFRVETIQESRHVGRSYNLLFDDEEYVLEAETQLEIDESLIDSLKSSGYRELVPPKRMLSRARRSDKFLYLRVKYLLLEGGGSEEEWTWCSGSSDPSTYALKIYPEEERSRFTSLPDLWGKNKVESVPKTNIEKVKSLSFATKVVIAVSVVYVAAILVSSAWYLFPLFF